MNDFELFLKLFILGLTPEEICDKLEFDFESIIITSNGKYRNTPSLLL